MPARDTARWILEAVKSIEGQFPFDGWSWALRIGVDACEPTSRTLEEHGVPHWFSRAQVGPYVMRNSLIALAPAEAWAMFDADDMMQGRYLSTVVQLAGADGIGGAARVHVDESGARISTGIEHNVGVSCYSAAAMEALGGFKAWPVAADRDMHHRAACLKIPTRRTKEVRYFRRVHPGSLTQSRTQGWGTSLRRSFVNRIALEAGRGILRVEPRTSPLEWRGP